MSCFFINNIYTVILIPMWIFVLIVLGRFFDIIQSKRVISILTIATSIYTVIMSLGALIYLIHNPNFVYDNSFSFLKIQNLEFDFGVYVDKLSVLMALTVGVVSFFVQLYSTSYMSKDKSFPRFFGYLNLFNFSMLGFVLSPNLFQNSVFWELVGAASYLLIGFWYKKPSASFAAKKAFIMNRIGDVGLLLGTITVSYFMYQYSSSVSLATVPYSDIADVGSYLVAYTNDFVFNLVCIFLILGSIAKSAQFPLHTWLADAMEGPTPVSALIHSATMVAAGVYLIARLYPIYSLSEPVMKFIAIIGITTAIMCAFFALSQNDLKRMLAYSTSSQLGLMFMALGVGELSGGIYHLLTHAYFKSRLFRCAGIVISSVSGANDIRFMGEIKKKLPLTAFCYLVGCIAISGICLSGYFSKEMIFTSICEQRHFVYAGLFLLVAFMTAFYMFRSYFIIFEGKNRCENEIKLPSLTLKIAIFIPMIITVCLGFLTYKIFPEFIYFGHSIPQHLLTFKPQILSLGFALIGVILAFLIYCVNIKIWIPKFIYKLSYNRFYIDDLYRLISDKLYAGVSEVCKFIDKYIFNGFVVFCTLFTRSLSWILSRMQTGNFQSYLAYSISFIALAFVGLMLAYTIIIQYGLSGG